LSRKSEKLRIKIKNMNSDEGEKENYKTKKKIKNANSKKNDRVSEIVYFGGFLVLQLNTRLDLDPSYMEESSSLIKITISITKLIIPKGTY
jgi:hypothetical protein